MTAPFEAWVDAVFDHPVDGPEWFWAPEFNEEWEALGLKEDVTVAHLTRLFGQAAVLKKYSLPQVAQGIWFLVGDSPAQPCHTLLKATVAPEARVACVESFAQFFRDFVAVEAPGAADIESDPFHIACYMWWDNFPTWGGPKAGEPELHDACLEVMAQTLALPSEVCQLSALHGLNHWYLHHRARVERTIDEFLSHAEHVTPLVKQYAGWARQGCAQ